MRIQLTLSMSGLMAYVIEDKRIDALILASREHAHDGHGHHPHADAHTPALLLPLDRLSRGGSAADMVLDAGSTEYGVWLLSHSVIEVRLDGKAPSGQVQFREDGSGEKPACGNDDSLYWLASISRAADMECRFRSDALPPRPSPLLVTGVVRLADGRVAAQWPSEEAKEEVWTFRLPPEGPNAPTKPNDYVQALADGIRWSLEAEHRIEIQIHSTTGGRMRTLVISATAEDEITVDGTICSKPATLGGMPSHEPAGAITHFALFYDLVEPSPPMTSRRVPSADAVSADAMTTKTNRCPGSSA